MKTKLVFLTLAMMAAVNTGFSQAVAFTQITNGAIATDMGTYTRSAWGDFNNDGYLDLFVSNWDHRTNVFYWNNGDGTFTKLTQGDPVQDADYHTGAAAADFDNDGYLDLLVSTGGPSAASRNLLYHNNGDGTFSRVSGGIVTNQLGFFNACTWADYDNDGYVDLFITDTGDANNDGGKSLLFHNNGNGTFTKVTSGAVVNDISVGNGALWADYDNDGFMDLIVINIANNGHNFLYHNNRNGTFTRILTNAIVTDSWPAGAEGAAWGDYDNDGLLDLFVTDNNGTRNRLYHNNGNGAFTNVSSGPMLVPRTGFASGAAWGDYDNDGYLDLFVAYYGATNALYHNNGDGTFTQILIGAPVDNNGS
jgi:enediyne biosynthesis protein E4